MHVTKQGHREAEGSDSMILQRVDEIGIAKKRELLEKLKALIAKEMGGVCAYGDAQEVPKIRIGRLLLQGTRLIWPPEMEVQVVWKDLLSQDRIRHLGVEALRHHRDHVCKRHPCRHDV